MKFNNIKPPLIFINSVTVLFVYDGDGQTKNMLGRGTYHSNTAREKTIIIPLPS